MFVNVRLAIAKCLYPTLSDATGVDLFSEGGTAKAGRLDTWQIEAAGLREK